MADADQTPKMVINPQVVYDVGDLLDRLGTRLDTGFATLIEKLDNKADKSDLAAINARLDEHSKEIGQLKDRQREDEAAQRALLKVKSSTTNWRRWAIEAVISAAATAGILIGVLH